MINATVSKNISNMKVITTFNKSSKRYFNPVNKFLKNNAYRSVVLSHSLTHSLTQNTSSDELFLCQILYLQNYYLNIIGSSIKDLIMTPIELRLFIDSTAVF